MSAVKKIVVHTDGLDFPIFIGAGLLSQAGFHAKKIIRGKKIALISDSHVAPLYLKACQSALQKAGFYVHPILMPAGETHKTVSTASRLWGELIRAGLHRDDGVVALGGGVVGDVASFVAATYMRGIKLIQIPTTVVGQVDSSIGGKTGVDHPLGKNLIGAFYQPELVLIDPQLLVTLPAREVRNGLAEIIKYGVIGDARFFQFLEKNRAALASGRVRLRDLPLWEKIITLSASMKAKVVSHDEKEGDLRRILNYGHTFGHAIETATAYRKFLHGEAVSIGMVAAARMAVKAGLLHPSEAARLESLLSAVGLPVSWKKGNRKKIIALMGRDKKVKAGKVHFVLPYRIGSVVVRGDLPNRLVKQSVESVTRG